MISLYARRFATGARGFTLSHHARSLYEIPDPRPQRMAYGSPTCAGLGGGIVRILLGFYEHSSRPSAISRRAQPWRELLPSNPPGHRKVVAWSCCQLLTLLLPIFGRNMIFFMGCSSAPSRQSFRIHHDMKPTVGASWLLVRRGPVMATRLLNTRAESKRRLHLVGFGGLAYNTLISFPTAAPASPPAWMALRLAVGRHVWKFPSAVARSPTGDPVGHPGHHAIGAVLASSFAPSSSTWPFAASRRDYYVVLGLVIVRFWSLPQAGHTGPAVWRCSLGPAGYWPISAVGTGLSKEPEAVGPGRIAASGFDPGGQR